MSPTLAILLHGVNARGRDVAALARNWDLPEMAVAAPDGPEPSGETPGARRWFSLQGITPENRPGRVVAARAAFDRILEETIAAHGLSGRPERVALVGFSQGAIMALDAVASGRWPVAAVVALSGRYATPDALPARTPALIVHGEADPAIPPSESLNADLCLRRIGCPVETHLLPGLGHHIGPESAALTRAFLRRHLG